MKKKLMLIICVATMASCSEETRVHFGATNLPDKDPKDHTLTSNSSKWTMDTFCPKCLTTIEHSEFMSAICNSCGTVYNDCLAFRNRSHRQIVQNKKWVWQYKYGYGSEISEKRLHD